MWSGVRIFVSDLSNITTFIFRGFGSNTTYIYVYSLHFRKKCLVGSWRWKLGRHIQVLSWPPTTSPFKSTDLADLETQMLGGLQHALPLKHETFNKKPWGQPLNSQQKTLPPKRYHPRVDVFNFGQCQPVDRYRGKSFIEDVRKMLSTTGGARSTQLNVGWKGGAEMLKSA